jgi:tetratricopeptide (TPR) repeat protein
MRSKKTDDASLTFKTASFSRLVEEVDELARIRREYAAVSPVKRRRAADFQYHAAGAEELFARAIGKQIEEGPWPGEAVALAIDPEFAPAILTIGSWEWIHGRKEEAMELFLRLTDLSPDTEDLPIVIDKAGDFLCDVREYDLAFKLYSVAADRHPNVGIFYNGMNYCAGKLGRYEEAVGHARKTVELDPENHRHLSDLGWSLVEAGHLEEAETVLEKAVALSPADYELAKGNLKELRRRRQLGENR